MNSARKWIRDVFGFSGNEINGFLILLPLMVVLIFSEPVYRLWLSNSPRQYPEDREKLDSLVANWDFQLTNPLISTTPQPAPFIFDPNTARPEELRSLGFPRNLASRIAAYRLKGGVFRIKSDLMKIYGMDSALYQQLNPYIKLPASVKIPPVRQPPQKGLKFEPWGKRGLITRKTFDINTADTILLKGVYGIGSRLAARIIKFRDALGGFVRPEQLNEVYGLDSMVVKRLLEVSFIKSGFVPLKININIADEEQLSAHPYIRHGIAHGLVTFRFQHGDFANVEDIKKLSIMKEEEVDRLMPYITVRD